MCFIPSECFKTTTSGFSHQQKAEGLVCSLVGSGEEENEGKKKAGLGEKGLLVLWSGLSPCVFLRPLCLFPSLFFSSVFFPFYRQGKPCGDNGIRDKP